MNSGATFSTISSGAIVRMQKKTQFLFTKEETFWLPMTRRSGCWGCRSGYFRFMLDRQHEPKGHRQMLQIFQKLQCLTDPSILTMICKRFIYVLTRNWSNDNPFLCIIGPFNCQHSQRPLPVSASVTPAHPRRWVHPKESWKLQQFVMGIQNKHLIFLRIVFSL